MTMKPYTVSNTPARWSSQLETPVEPVNAVRSLSMKKPGATLSTLPRKSLSAMTVPVGLGASGKLTTDNKRS